MRKRRRSSTMVAAIIATSTNTISTAITSTGTITKAAKSSTSTAQTTSSTPGTPSTKSITWASVVAKAVSDTCARVQPHGRTPTQGGVMLANVNEWLDRYVLPWPVRFLTFRFVILATLALLIPLILFADNQALVLGINSY